MSIDFLKNYSLGGQSDLFCETKVIHWCIQPHSNLDTNKQFTWDNLEVNSGESRFILGKLLIPFICVTFGGKWRPKSTINTTWAAPPPPKYVDQRKRTHGDGDFHFHLGLSKKKHWGPSKKTWWITHVHQHFFGGVYYLVGGWPTLLKNMKVSWDDEIPEKRHVPNHQSVMVYPISKQPSWISFNKKTSSIGW